LHQKEAAFLVEMEAMVRQCVLMALTMITAERLIVTTPTVTIIQNYGKDMTLIARREMPTMTHQVVGPERVSH
jgi:hypothetical protein